MKICKGIYRFPHAGMLQQTYPKMAFPPHGLQGTLYPQSLGAH